MTLNVVILAAGQGLRMKSEIPKVLHKLAGKPLLEHVICAAKKLSADKTIVIYGYKGEEIRHHLAHCEVEWIQQLEQLGTGDALKHALPYLSSQSQTLVLCGDTPLISVETLKQLIGATDKNALGVVTADFPNPRGFGRIIRDKKNNLISIIEEKDLSSTDQHSIQEVNTGVYLIPTHYLPTWLPKLNANNAQKEFYLTDIIAMAVKEKIAINSIQPDNYQDFLGVNDRVQLSELERTYQYQQAKKWMLQGVSFRDPHRFDVRGDIYIGSDTIIDVGVILEGQVKIGSHCIIGANSIIKNSILSNHVEIKPNSVIDGAEIAEQCVVGPFARLRPGTILETGVHVGNFSEIKNSVIGNFSKIHHVSYIGDTEMGQHVNIGAGTITCNYDGVNKHRTLIENHVFIGSNSSLVAPLKIGEGAFIGAGSTISHDAPAKQLTLGRARQCTIEGWQLPETKKET